MRFAHRGLIVDQPTVTAVKSLDLNAWAAKEVPVEDGWNRVSART
jgi:hypothetical protein